MSRAFQGTFELTARNGEFIRSAGMDATFDYLNATGDFQVAFPDLNRQTFLIALSPADIGAELINIPLRILGMPIGAMRLFTPPRDLRDQKITRPAKSL